MRLEYVTAKCILCLLDNCKDLPREEQTVEDLVKKARSGDKDSFSKLISGIQDQAYRVAYSYLKDEEDSLDAVCDSVEKAFIKLNTLRQPKYFKRWFLKIVQNTSLQYLRKRKTKEQFIEKSKGENILCEVDASREDILDLRENLAKLSSSDREILYQRYWQDKKLKDIASSLHMPINSVKTRLYSSLGKLRNQMEVHEREKKQD